MRTRLLRWLLEVLISLDQLGHVLLGGPKFILIGGPVPSADETISSKVGRHAVKGERWALIAERLIDTAFGAGHCRQSIETGR